jgi:hypothetical protein
VSTPVRDPLNGDRFWLLGDRAVYSLFINRTDNTVVSEGAYVAAYVPNALLFLPVPAAGGRVLAVLVVDDGVVQLYDWAAKRVLVNASGFPYANAIVSDMCVLGSPTGAPADSVYLLLLDDDEFGTHRTSCSVARLTGLLTPGAQPSLSLVQLLSPIADPAAIACSPFGNSALIASDQGNALLRVTFDPSNSKKPFAVAGPIAYVGAAPQLPSELVAAATPALAGRVFVGELSGLRQVQFSASGNITDLGLFDFGPAMSDLCGALGVNF